MLIDADWLLNVQMFQSSNVPMFQCSNVSMFQCSNVPMFQCTNVPMFQCSNLQMCKCSNIQMLKCSNVQMIKGSNVQMSNVKYQMSNVDKGSPQSYSLANLRGGGVQIPNFGQRITLRAPHRLNLCWSVPPEYLRSFLMLDLELQHPILKSWNSKADIWEQHNFCLPFFEDFESQHWITHLYFPAESYGSWARVESSKRGEICEWQMLSSVTL